MNGGGGPCLGGTVTIRATLRPRCLPEQSRPLRARRATVLRSDPCPRPHLVPEATRCPQPTPPLGSASLIHRCGPRCGTPRSKDGSTRWETHSTCGRPAERPCEPRSPTRCGAPPSKTSPSSASTATPFAWPYRAPWSGIEWKVGTSRSWKTWCATWADVTSRSPSMCAPTRRPTSPRWTRPASASALAPNRWHRRHRLLPPIEVEPTASAPRPSPSPVRSMTSCAAPPTSSPTPPPCRWPASLDARTTRCSSTATRASARPTCSKPSGTTSRRTTATTSFAT
jgi:hypothetical protein